MDTDDDVLAGARRSCKQDVEDAIQDLKAFKHKLHAICKNYAAGRKGRNGIEERVQHPDWFDRNGNYIYKDCPSSDSSPSVISL